MGWFSNLFSKLKESDDSTESAELSIPVSDEKEDAFPDSAKPKKAEVFAPNAPALRDGLLIRPTLSFNTQDIPYLSGAHVMHDGTHVITVNEIGRKLLSMSDGTTTINDMVEMLGLEKNASEVGLFFVALGKSGYLKNRIEINLYETKSFVEEHV
ncbi:MAG TPA: hypothetical protein VHT34_00920 [Clostridia bacterium]|nr:hypothetical protein [Clostridia bacterium]